MVETWHELHRTLQQVDPDELRAIGESVPENLAGTTMLLVRHGSEPVREYVYGATRELERAGTLAGFSATPLEGDAEPELPDTIRAVRHPIIPWRARLNSKSTMEKMRTDVSGMRKSIEAAMPSDSYVSVTIRPQGYFEQSRIRNWVADEHATVEDGNELVSANTMCARVSVGCADDAQARSLTERVGQTMFPLLSNMSSHRSMPRFGLLALSAGLSLAMIPLCVISPVNMRMFLVMEGVVAAFVVVPALLGMLLQARARRIVKDGGSASLFYRIPPHYYGCCLMAAAYVALMLLPVPWWVLPAPMLLTVVCAARWRTRTLWDDIMQYPRRYYWLRRKRKATDADAETKLGNRDPRIFATGYGPQRSTIVLAPLTVVGLYTPVGSSGAMKQDLHPVPEILSHDGLYLGKDQTGRDCCIPAGELFGGIAIFGAAGRGKSVLAHGIMQWADLHRDDTSRMDWGPDSRIIDFEMKDDSGVSAMNRFRERNNLRRGRVSYIADPASPCPDLLGMLDGRDARQTAADIATGMQFAFEPGDILNDSLRVITTGMTIAIAVQRHIERNGNPGDGPSDVISRIHQLEPTCPGAAQARDQASPIGWCVMALGGSDGQAGSMRALGKVCGALALETQDPDMILAAKAAEQLYGRPDEQGRNRLTNQQILQKTNASLNKVDQFLGCEHMFTSRRARITWEQVLSRPGDYHFVLSDRRRPDGTLCQLPDGMNRKIGKWMMRRLWAAAKRDCQDWKDAGRHTMFVCDELSLLANADDTILREMKDQGRSFGWINVFATQYPTQLPPLLLTSVMGYSTFISFDNTDPDMAARTAQRLTGRDGLDGWDAAAVQNLPLYAAAVRTRAKEQLQPAFIVNVENFDRA